jgi:hypothetical protein
LFIVEVGNAPVYFCANERESSSSFSLYFVAFWERKWSVGEFVLFERKVAGRRGIFAGGSRLDWVYCFWGMNVALEA